MNNGRKEEFFDFNRGNSIENDVIDAHKYCYNHKDKLLKDTKCGCFYCLKIFNSVEIKMWINDISGIALCPYCGIDSVIGESSGYPIIKDF